MKIESMPAAAPVAAIIVSAEAEAAAELWAKAILQFKTKDKQLITDILVAHWKKGEFLNDLQKNAKKYGGRTISTFAEALKISEEAAWSYARFFTVFSKEDLDKAIGLGCSWNVISNVLSIQDPIMRWKMIERVTKREITVDQMKEEVKAINNAVKAICKAEGKKTTRGGAGIATVFKSTASVCVALCKKSDELLTVIDDYNKVDDENRKKDLKEKLDEARKALESTHEQIEAVLRRIPE